MAAPVKAQSQPGFSGFAQTVKCDLRRIAYLLIDFISDLNGSLTHFSCCSMGLFQVHYR